MKLFIKCTIAFLVITALIGCIDDTPPVSDSGVSKASVTIPTGADGLTTEQRNVGERLKTDNKPGSIKHLYVISAYSGQTIFYSTVKGKVTSSGKRLTNTKKIDGYFQKPAVLPAIQDDGTYGSSIPYIYWWDVQGRYHQHYVSGGQIIHVSDKPINVKSVIINFEKK